jgi:DNA mismatch repair protein MutL
MPIKVLPPDIVARIAAGEVVERPASVVKELVENAIDASATEIAVEIEGAGINLIRVSDNGTGIPSGEMALVLGRHATSKITGIDDLENITTLGFRGEALPSIASVADMEIISHARNETPGHFLSIKDGVITDGSRGRPPGTTITVRNLFRRVPARLKFLKTAATETARLTGVNGRNTIRTPGTGQLADVIGQIFGQDNAGKMLPIRENSDAPASILVTGMIGNPDTGRNTADQISLFVNRRWVVSRLLVKAVAEAYHGLLMAGKHPVAVVNIFLPPSDIDVNIHPAKTEIKFRDEHAVFGAVEKVIRLSLLTETVVFNFKGTGAAWEGGVAEVVRNYPRESAPGYPFPPARGGFPASTPLPETPRNGSEAATGEPGAPRLVNTLPVLRVMGQAMGNYIVAEGPDGLYIIDQHAAHERILFEKLNTGNGDDMTIELQGLLESFPVDVTPAEQAVLTAHLDYLKSLGFTLEPFGAGSYLVRTVPVVVASFEWRAALTEILETLASRDKTYWRERIAVSLACHSAIRSGGILVEKEMEALIRALERTAVPLTCPHGRPTVMRISQAQLEKNFGRV